MINIIAGIIIGILVGIVLYSIYLALAAWKFYKNS